MIKILISILICFAASKDLIMVGDFRIQEMAQVLMNVEFSSYNVYGIPRQCIMTEYPVSYEGYSIEIIAVDQYHLDDVLAEKEPFNTVHNKLKKAKQGTSVILSMGFQNLNRYNDIFVFYGKLADKYPKLNFYAISLIGINDGDINSKTNIGIKDFNKNCKNRIELVGFPNLYYKNILNNNNPSQIVVDKNVINILDYSTDNAGFFKNGYIKIFKAMVEGL